MKGRTFTKQGELYAFGENPPPKGGTLSGGRKVKPIVLAEYRSDTSEFVSGERGERPLFSCAAAPVFKNQMISDVQKQINDCTEAYLHIEWPGQE